MSDDNMNDSDIDRGGSCEPMPSTSHDSSFEKTTKNKVKTKYAGAAKYNSRFSTEWTKEWPFVQQAAGKATYFLCTVCRKEISCAHQGKRDVIRHIGGLSHSKFATELKKQPKLSFVSTKDEKVMKAEVKFTHLLVEKNIPLSFADHLNRAVKQNFPDSEIAKNYHCGKTKTFCILNGALAPHYQASLVERMKNSYFSLAIDGSNDSGLEKMNPLTVRLFDVNRTCVVTEFLDMCITSGPDAGTARAIFDQIDECLNRFDISWSNCKGFSIDNTNVNVGKHNSIKSRVILKNKAIFFMGCPCHIVHNASCKAAGKFSIESKFDIEDFAVDLYYWFDKSTKRKSTLQEFCEFCDIEYRKILKHLNVRWLSLEIAVERILKQYSALKSYFVSTSESAARFVRLQNAFSDPMTEVYLMFFQATLPTFTNLNKFLQYEHTCIHLLHDKILEFLQKLCSKFIEVKKLKECVENKDFSSAHECQLNDENLFIGFTTKQKLKKMLSDGDISQQDIMRFHRSVREFFNTSLNYAMKNFPIDDVLIKSCKLANFKERLNVNFDAVEIIIEKLGLSELSSPSVVDELSQEFISYQLMDDKDVDEDTWKIATNEEGFVRMDVVWGHIFGKTRVDGGKYFRHLDKIMEAVLVLPHSNATEERVFSMIRKNKNEFRSSLNIDGTLSSIITVKLASEQNQSFEPSSELLKTAKKATKLYNEGHK